MCDQESRYGADNASHKLACHDGDGLLADLFDLLIKRDTQCDDGRLEQKFDIFSAGVIRFIGNITRFQDQDDKDNGHQNRVQYDRFEAFLYQLCAPEQSYCHGDGKQFAVQKVTHNILRMI